MKRKDESFDILSCQTQLIIEFDGPSIYQMQQGDRKRKLRQCLVKKTEKRKTYYILRC